MMDSLWSLFCENSGVDPDGSQKSGTNCPSSADSRRGLNMQHQYIVTYMNEEFIPAAPDMNKIHIEDIAHALSLLCRANGHIDTFFSIARHSLNCALEAKARGYTAKIQLICLLHDASEAYISDITRPVKAYLEEYQIIEKRLQDAIYTKFLGTPLSSDEFELMNEIDNDMLVFEFAKLKTSRKLFDHTPKLYSEPILECSNFKETESTFLKTYYGIMHAGIIQGR